MLGAESYPFNVRFRPIALFSKTCHDEVMPRFQTQSIDGSEYGEDGYFDTDSQYQYVLSKEERHIDYSRDVYVFGYAGADGIEFVLKPDDEAVYAYLPIDDKLVRLAPGFDSFIKGWIDGSIGV